MFSLDDLLAEPNEFRICDRCKATNMNTLKPKLEAIDPKAQIYVGCQSFCGPGRNKPFVFVNNKPLTGTTEDEVLEKVRDFLGK